MCIETRSKSRRMFTMYIKAGRKCGRMYSMSIKTRRKCGRMYGMHIEARSKYRRMIIYTLNSGRMSPKKSFRNYYIARGGIPPIFGSFCIRFVKSIFPYLSADSVIWLHYPQQFGRGRHPVIELQRPSIIRSIYRDCLTSCHHGN